jgi:hypothetical protein
MQRQKILVAVLAAAFALGARTASADTIVLTSGFISQFAGDQSGFTLNGPGLTINGTMGIFFPIFSVPGNPIDLSGSYGVGGSCDGTAIINGVALQGSCAGGRIFLTGSLDISALPFIAPPITADLGPFNTPFTLTGNIVGQAFGGPPVFSVNVAGSGIAHARYEVISTEPPSFKIDALGFELSAPSPSPTPEPGTLTLLGGGLAGLVIRRRRKPRSLETTREQALPQRVIGF